MQNSGLVEQASFYIPRDWLMALASGKRLPERTYGAALFVDISGFTALTDALVQKLGLRRGAEELPRYLNQIYDGLIHLVDTFGGSVVGFAGDAITCWFEGQAPAQGEPSDPGATLRAVACALQIQEMMCQFGWFTVSTNESYQVAVKAAVASGPALRFVVGDPQTQLIPTLAGATLKRMADAEHLAKRGEVVVDEETVGVLGERLTILEWRKPDDGGPGEGFAVLEGLVGEAPPAAWPPLLEGMLTEEQVRPWVLPAIYQRLQAGLGDFLTELRPAVALFLRFSGIDYEQDPRAGLKMDAYIRWVQEVLAHYAGTLIQLTIGDKGCYLYAAFGAPVAHEDDVRRAVMAALELRAHPARFGYISPVQIGVSQGMMRTGTYGGITRRTYGSLGDQVNFAARLMQLAGSGEVLVSQAVYKKLGGEFHWEILPDVRMKGKLEPVWVARLLDRIEGQSPDLQPAGVLVGRMEERRCLEAGLDKVQAGANQVLLIEGEAGIGKSRLVAELTQMARSRGLEVLQGAGHSIEQATPYRAWRDLFNAFFELAHISSQEARWEQVTRRTHELLAGAVDMDAVADCVPLLNDVLNLGLPETRRSAALDPAQRQHALIELLSTLLQIRAGQTPLILVLEDAQWLDSLSWELARQAAGVASSGLLLALVLRPLEGDPARQAKLAGLRGLPGAEFVTLLPMSAAETVAVAAARLGLQPDGLPAPIAALVTERSEGNPFFAEQLVLALLDQGLIELDLGSQDCRICGDLAQARESLPGNIQGFILSRLDRLSPESQLVLKVAAVIGRTFAYSPLGYTIRLYMPLTNETLTAQLGDLEARDLAALLDNDPELTYIFKYLMVQDIAYQTMAFEQRRQLHCDLARWYENVSAYSSDLSPLYALLAYHWTQAEEADKAAHYLLLAGDEARRLYALPEAIDYYRQALGFQKQIGEDEQTARTLMKLGLTYHLAFDYRSSRQAYDEGFVLWQQAGKPAAGGSMPPAPHPLRMDWPYTPLTLDPNLAVDVDTEGVLDQLFSGLVDLRPGLDLTPHLARSWEIRDEGGAYVFRLRDDAYWSDGVRVTAADFEFSWKRVLDPATEAPLAHLLYDIKGARAFHQGEHKDPSLIGVRATDDLTLVVELEQPSSYFLFLMAYTTSLPVPRHAVERHGAAWCEVPNLVTNGPFCLDTWSVVGEQEGIIGLKRSSGYFGRYLGNVVQVDLHAIPDGGARLEAYEQNRLDTLSFRNLTEERSRIRQKHSGEYLSAPQLTTAYVGFQVVQPPFDSLAVRQAFVHAVDREKLADVNLEGFSFPALGGFTPPGMPGHSTEAGLVYDPALARQLLAQAGYVQGDCFPRVEILGGPGQDHELEYMVGQWRENLGVEVSWKTLDWEEFMDRLEQGAAQLFVNAWTSDFPDPDNFLRGNDAIRWARWQNDQYQALVSQARQVLDQKKRLEMYAQADKVLVQSAVLMPYKYLRSHFLIKPWVKRFPTSPAEWWYFKDAIIEPHTTD